MGKMKQFRLTLPRNLRIRKDVENFFNRLVNIPEPKGNHLSSHWAHFLPQIQISLIPDRKLPRKIEINQGGLAELTRLNIVTIILFLLQISRNIFLLIKYRCSLRVLFAVCVISIRTGRMLCFDIVKHAILINKIKSIIDFRNASKIVIIGDGFGFLGSLLKFLYPKVRITFVNLQKNLFLDYCFFVKSFQALADTPTLIEAHQLKNFQKDELLFFNVASLGEMTSNQIQKYLHAINEVGGTLVSLNRNSKKHPDGTIVNLCELLESEQSDLLFDENPCNFYANYPTNGFNPGFLPFDGEIHLKILKF
jgi:hypothetical protein